MSFAQGEYAYGISVSIESMVRLLEPLFYSDPPPINNTIQRQILIDMETSLQESIDKLQNMTSTLDMLLRQPTQN